jgi:hypothetical protein
MSRKDYEAAAAAISLVCSKHERILLANRLGAIFAIKNAAFKWSVWYAACRAI